ncbi:Uncharacterised protein [Salmonella enterica subsp. arizonae]|nr:Uncharacterised protein [Salmonella enterica subsp. arizonae]
MLDDVTKLSSGFKSRMALQGDGPLREPSPASRVSYVQLSTTESEPTPKARGPTIQQLTIPPCVPIQQLSFSFFMSVVIKYAIIS